MTLSLLENLFTPGTIERLGWMLVHVLWQATAVALLLALVLRLLRKAGANTRYVVACSALALMVALPLVTLGWLKTPGPVAEAGPAPVRVALPMADAPAVQPMAEHVGWASAHAENPRTGQQEQLPAPLETADLSVPIPLQERIVSALEPALPYVVLGWLVGVFGLSAWHLGGWAQLQRLRRRMVCTIGAPLQRRLEDLSARLGVRRAVGLLESALVEVPTVVGWLRPVILLPASALTGLRPEQLEAILAHELAHIRRYDYLVNMLQTVVEILGFYHPAVWWVSHRIRIERENCCDDLAVHVCGNSLQYARALACMEEIRHRGADLAVAATGGSLMARIARLLGRPAAEEDRRFAWLPGLIALLLVAGVIIPAALVLGTPQRPPIVQTASAVVASADQGSPQPEAAQGDTAQVLLEFRILKLSNDAQLDRETVLQMANSLGIVLPARGPNQAGPGLDLTLGEFLRRYVVHQPLSEQGFQALVRLLQSRRDIQMLAAPGLLTRDGAPAEIRVASELPPPRSIPSAEAERIEYGTVVNVTPQVLDGNRVALKLMAQISDLLPGPDANEPAVARTSAETSLTAWNDRYLIWAAIESPTTGTDPGASRPSIYILVKPHINLPPGGLANVPAEREPNAVPRRQVRLEVRTVTLERGGLVNLNVEWNWPTTRAGVFPGPSGSIPSPGASSSWPGGVQIGHTADGAVTASLLGALDLLQKDRLADISSQQILAQDRRESRIKAITEEWFIQAAPTGPGSPTSRSVLQKVESGTVLAVTPYIGDNDDITLKMSVEVSESLPQKARGADLPVVTRRMARNTITIRDGGTVALAGLVENRTGPSDKSTREVAIFVTAHLADDVARAISETPPPAERSLQQPPSSADPKAPLSATAPVGASAKITARFVGTDLLEVLAEIARQTGVKIVPDATMKTRRIAAVLVDVTAETALQAVLENTSYTFRKTDDGTYLVFRPLSYSSGGSKEVVAALQDIAYAAGVPIIPDPNLTGTVNATFENVTLEEALQILLAGKPFVFGRMPHYYLIADRSVRDGSFAQRIETRRVRLNHVEAGRARALLSPVFAPYVRAELPDTHDPNDGQNMLIVTAPAGLADRIVEDLQKIDRFKRHVLLEARVVSMEKGNRSNLGVAWSWPKSQNGVPSAQDTGGWLGGPQAGYARDQTATNSVVEALKGLEQDHRATSLANLKAISPDARQWEMKITQDQWSLKAVPPPSDRYMITGLTSWPEEVVLRITPFIEDNNDIILVIRAAVTDSIPKARGSDLPLVTRRIARSSVTIKDGGAGAVVGLTVDGLKEKATTGREVAVFVTAHLIPEPREASLPTPSAEPVLYTATVGAISPEQVVNLRREYINSDPLVRELVKNIVATDRELIILQQTHTPTHPALAQKNALLEAFRRKLDERRTELQEEFDRGMQERLSSVRRKSVNADPIVVELSKSIAEAERDPIAQQQTHATPQPAAIPENMRLETLLQQLAPPRTELEHQSGGVRATVQPAVQESQANPASRPPDPAATPDVPAPPSQAWHIMRQWNCPPLLLGLTQQLAKVLEPGRRNDSAWQEVGNGGTLRLKLQVEGDLPGEVVVGLFKDAQWSAPPVAVRRLGAGTHVLTGLPAGQYQIGAMLGEAPVPLALGVQRTWPEPVEIGQNQTATAEVLVSEAFQKWASGWYNAEVAKDYVGQWDDLDETNLLQGQLTGPDGKPVPFGMVEIIEHNPGARSRATADQGTNEQGVFKYDGMNWPYQITALWRESIPSAWGYRRQRMYLSRVLEGPHRQDFRFAPFPEGTAKVAGRVLDQNGKPVQSFFLRVYMPPFSELDLSHQTGGYKTQVTYDVPVISQEGRFELGGLPAGRATVTLIPFEVPRYQHERGRDITLKAGQTAPVDVELLGKAVFHGHVVFEDGTPAVITPAPWRGAVTRVLRTFGPRAGSVGEVNAEGYFTVYLDDSERETLAQGDSRLLINVPTDQERRWDTVGTFPFEKLAEEKDKAGVLTVKRAAPTPTLPAALRRGGPLPPGWRLEYQPETRPDRRRWTQVILETRPAPSDTAEGRSPDTEQFELYGPDGKRVTTFGARRTTHILDQAQQYALIGRPSGEMAPDDWQLTRGPFLLDLSRPGRYILTMDLDAKSATDPDSSMMDAPPGSTGAFPPVAEHEVMTRLLPDWGIEPWGPAVEGVQLRLRATRYDWRADEIPAFRWDVRNAGTRQYLYVPAAQSRAQLEMDGVWHVWPIPMRVVRLAELGVEQSLDDQLVTLSPMWSRARPQDLQPRGGSAWGTDPAQIASSLQLAPGKHTIRLAVLVEPSRVDTGDVLRVVSPPMEIAIASAAAGATASWPPGPRLAQAVKETFESAAFALTWSAQPEPFEIQQWTMQTSQALAVARQAAARAENTPLHASVKPLADALAALQQALAKDPNQAGDRFSAVSKAYYRLVNVFSGEIPPTPQPGQTAGSARPPADARDANDLSIPRPIPRTPESSPAWYIMRHLNGPPLLLGLTQQLLKTLQPARLYDAMWQEVAGGGSLTLEVKVEHETGREIVVGLFQDAKWSQEPVAVRLLPREGTYTLTGLPPGRYQIGAMIGRAPSAAALGVQKTWPEAIEINSGQTTTAELLVARDLAWNASGWHNREVSRDYRGDWSLLNEDRLLQGRLTGPDGAPIRFAQVQVREYQGVPAGSIAAPNLGTSEDGLYKFDGMKWPYRVGAIWREPLPDMLGSRYQYKNVNRVLEGPQKLDIQFDPFPAGTARIAGHVTDQDGDPVTEFFLRVQTVQFPASLHPNRVPDGKTYTEFGYTVPFLSADGGFELGGLPQGRVSVDAVAFDGRQYKVNPRKEVMLAAEQTTTIQVELTRNKLLYGRVLFEDGRPAVISPTPWEGAKTMLRIDETVLFGQPVGHSIHDVGEADAEGYIAAYFRDTELEHLRSGSAQLRLRLPGKYRDQWQSAGSFPFDKLSEDKARAGTVTIRRPES